MSSRRTLCCFVAVLISGVGGSLLAAEESRAQEARAAYAYVTANLNQRAGPATRFPALQVIPARTRITVNGCLEDLSWCEGAYGDIRGWMSATYLRLYDYNQRAWVEVDDYARSTRLARYTFDLERYWAAHYRDRPFYAQRAAWLVAPRSQVVDTGVFYRELSPYGRWTQLEGRYVWMPQVREGWRPYTEGRWEYTQRYGWTWVSYEPFGWATYHYGRWAYSNRLGWVWVPGTQWAPAWVAWRGSDDHLAWAPLPPDAGPDFQINIGFNEIPSYYWQVVPSAYFLRPNLAEVVVRDDRDRRARLEQARPIGNVTVVNNTVVNNVININYVEERTRERVVPREVVITNDQRRQAQASGEEVVRIYQPPVSEAPATETPPAVLPAEVAAGQSQTVGQAGDEPATDDRVAQAPEPEAAAPPTETPPLAEDEAPVADDAQASESPAEAADEAPPLAVEEPAPPADEPPPPPPAAEEPAPSADEPPPPVAEEPAPPADEPPPPPAAEEPAPPADEPPPPPAAEEPAPPADVPPPAAEEPAPPAAEPPPPAAEEPAPPADEPPPPPAAEEPAPPADEPPPPPAAEEPAPPADEPPPPPPAAEEPAPPAEEPPPPPPAAEEPAPPADEPPPPPAAEEPAPPAVEPPPPADEPPPPAAAKEPPPPDAEEAPAAQERERPRRQECGEGMRLNRQGECVPRRNQQGD